MLIPMLFFQYDAVDDFPGDLGIDNYVASSKYFVMLASFVSISVLFMFVIAVVMCSR